MKRYSVDSDDSNYNSDNETHRRRSKSVSFSPRTQIKKTLSVKDMTDSERRNSWLQKEEVAKIINSIQWVIYNAEKHSKAVDYYGMKHTLRGLETKMGLRMKNRRRRISAAREEVLCAQQIQYMDGYTDDEAIAEAYASISEKCQREAQMLAFRDQKEALAQ